MSLKDLTYALTVGLTDKLTGPGKKVGLVTKKLSKNLFETKNAIKSVNKQAKQVTHLQQLDKKMGSLATETGGAQKKLAGLWKEFNKAKAAGKSTKLLQKSIGVTQRKIGKLTNEQRKLKNQAAETRSELRQSGIDTRNLGRAQQSLTSKTSKLNSQLDRQKTKMERVHAISDKLGKAWRRIKGFALGGALTLAAAGAPMLATAANFEQSMSTVGAITGATTVQMATLTKTARDLGANTSFSATEAASGMKYLGMAGFKTNQIIETMPGLLNLAKAGATDLGRTAEISSIILKQFGLESDQMGRVGDVLTKTFTSSATNLEMLSETMGYAGTVASGLGISLEETAALSGMLANAGLQGSKGGTTLRAMLIRLSAPAGSAAEMLQELGVKTRDASGNMLPILDIIGDLDKATKSMGSGAKMDFIKTVFGEEPAAGVAKLLASGKDGISAYLSEIQKADGTAAAIAKKMGDNLSGSVKQFQSAVESLSITMGNVFLPALTKLVNKFTEITRGFEDWSAKNPGLIEGLANTAIGFGTLVGVISALSFALPIVGRAFALLATGFMLNPIGAIVFALSMGVMAIIHNWDKLGPWFKKLWADILDDSVGLSDIFSNVGEDIMAGLGRGLDAGMAWVKEKITSLGALMSGWLSKKLEINSPSRVFAKIGGHISEGVGVGIQSKTPKAVSAIQGLANQLRRPLPAMVMGGVIAAGGMGSAMATGPITINIYPTAEQSAVDIGQEVARQITAIQRQQAARSRASLIDKS